MKYFPLVHDRFEHQFGIRALSDHESIIEKTECYEEEIRIKEQLLQRDRDNYVAALPNTEDARQEAADLVRTLLPSFDDALDDCPLVCVARQVQEDLVLMRGGANSGYPMIAGVVCFPSGWSITEKIGLSTAQIHSPVPEFASVMQHATEKLLGQLKAHRPVWRTNWGVRPSARLDQSPKQLDAIRNAMGTITGENAGDRCFFRVERQTLSRLPITGDILFTIHTHQCSLSELSASEKVNLLGVLKSCPEATLRYKGIFPMQDAVCRFLEGSR